MAAIAVPLVAQAQSGGLSGQLQDSSGAIIPNAAVELQRRDGSVVSRATSDSAGHFRLPPEAAGDYLIEVALPGFEKLEKPVHAPAAGPLTLTLAMASVATSVTVNAEDGVDVSSTESNSDAASLSSSDLKSLPILDGDVVSTLEAFLDTGAAGEGGATLVIDGVEMKTLGVSPSAIESMSINQDPYSARYRQPGRGQVEIVTKSTADRFHGSASFTYRNAVFNASNYFSPVKPPEARRYYEGFLTGPTRAFKDTAFLFSAQRIEKDWYQQVDALTPAGATIHENVAAPQRTTQLTMKLAHQFNDHHGAFLLYRFNDAALMNQGVGSLTLASGGYNAFQFDMDLTFHDDDAWAPNRLNQFNLLFERNIDRQVSAVQAPAVQVQGAFNSGGAQQDQLQTENNPNLSDLVSWTAGRQQWKFGVQLPNMGRRILEDNTNRQGTYTFASLAAYNANQPNTFTIQQGQTRFETLYLQPSAFVLDEVKLSKRLTVTPGLRYDWQNAIPETTRAFQPRLAVAYVLDKDHAMVLRTGGGIYMRRVGVNVGQQLVRYQNAAEQSYLLTSSICYNPVQQCNVLSAQPPSLFRYAPHLSAPFQGFFGMSVEREVTKKSTLTVGYEGYRGWHALRSVDVNAPLPPFTSTVRPNPAYAQVLQLQSGGYQKSDSLVASFRGRLSQYFTGFGQYTYSHADSNTQWSTYEPENQYDPNADWSRSDYDMRHRFNFFGTFLPDKPVNLGIGFYANSGTPYTETTGTDDFKTGVLNARPAGVPRNSLTQTGFQDVQLRVGYTRRLRPSLKDASPTLAESISSFNTLNRPNFENFVGVLTSPSFMHPTGAGGSRRLQLVVQYTF
jgi:hypothetical protein